MRLCRGGSPVAFGHLFERHRAAVWGFFRRRVVDRSRAEDLSQDTFLALLKGAERYEPRDAFRSYLFGIAFNILSEDRRRPRAITADEDELAALEARPVDMDGVLRVRQALAGLDGIDRDVLMLREFESLSYTEIAAVLAIPVNTVRSRLFRARVALKEKLQ